MTHTHTCMNYVILSLRKVSLMFVISRNINEGIILGHHYQYNTSKQVLLSCSTCHVEAANTYSSRQSSVKKSSQPFIVNDLIVLFFNQLGLGHTVSNIQKQCFCDVKLLTIKKHIIL